MAIPSAGRGSVGWLATTLCLLYGTAHAIDLPKGGVNLNGYHYWNPAPPFTNVAGMGNGWISHSPNNGLWDDERPIPLTADGYPSSLLPDQFARTLIFTHNNSIYPTGDFRVSWEGTGTFQLTGGQLVASDDKIASFHVTAPNPNGLLLSITSTEPSDPLRNIEVLLPDAPPGPATPLLNHEYAADLVNYGVVRYMDWNATNSQTITNWHERTVPTSFHWGSDRGVPYEAQIAASNELHQDLWLTVPHAATDDYVRSLATLVKSQLEPDLRVWIEYSNEVWNGQFTQFHYANSILRQQYGTDLSPMQAYGHRAAEIFTIFEELFPEDNSLVRVVSGQAANAWQLDQALQGVTDSGTTMADVAAIAPYFGLSNAQLTALYADYRSGTVDLERVFAELSEDLNMASVNWDDNRQVAQNFGIPLISYEAGQHIVPLPGQQQGDDGFVDLLADINRDPRMGVLYEQLIERWHSIGGQTLTLFSDVGNWSRSGYWGLKEQLDDIDSPKFQAIQNYLTQAQGDFNWDGTYSPADADALVQAINSGAPPSLFDLNGDRRIDIGDLDVWLSAAARANLPSGSTYGYGDANLDGLVNEQDLSILQTHLFQPDSGWSRGDFNADGYIDGSDFNEWHRNASLTQRSFPQVPEPNGFGLLLPAAFITVHLVHGAKKSE